MVWERDVFDEIHLRRGLVSFGESRPMRTRANRIFIAAAIALFIAVLNNQLDAEFARLHVSTESTVLNDLIVGFAAGLCVLAWAELSAERGSSRLSAEKARQDAILRERTRMACEIHDVIAQCFVAVILNVQSIEDFSDDPAQARMFSERALRVAREGLAESRSLVRGMRAGTPDEDLRGAVKRLADSLAEGTPLRIRCLVEEPAVPLSPERELQLLRILREALANAVNHAKARAISVSLCARNDQIQMCIEDDGCGFRLPSAVNGGTFGLTSMRQRARELGGILWIYTQPGRGTEVNAVIPVLDAVAERFDYEASEVYSSGNRR
jgi:signal transduction histidine kinase